MERLIPKFQLWEPYVRHLNKQRFLKIKPVINSCSWSQHKACSAPLKIRASYLLLGLHKLPLAPSPLTTKVIFLANCHDYVTCLFAILPTISHQICFQMPFITYPWPPVLLYSIKMSAASIAQTMRALMAQLLNLSNKYLLCFHQLCTRRAASRYSPCGLLGFFTPVLKIVLFHNASEMLATDLLSHKALCSSTCYPHSSGRACLFAVCLSRNSAQWSPGLWTLP